MDGICIVLLFVGWSPLEHGLHQMLQAFVSQCTVPGDWANLWSRSTEISYSGWVSLLSPFYPVSFPACVMKLCCQRSQALGLWHVPGWIYFDYKLPCPRVGFASYWHPCSSLLCTALCLPPSGFEHSHKPCGLTDPAASSSSGRSIFVKLENLSLLTAALMPCTHDAALMPCAHNAVTTKAGFNYLIFLCGFIAKSPLPQSPL